MAFYGLSYLPLEGNFGGKPTLTKTESGISKCTFTVYVNYPEFKGKDGALVKRPPFRVRCVAWRNTADYIAKQGETAGSISGIFSLAENTWEEIKDGVKVKHEGIEATPIRDTNLNIFSVVRKERAEGASTSTQSDSGEDEGELLRMHSRTVDDQTPEPNPETQPLPELPF